MTSPEEPAYGWRMAGVGTKKVYENDRIIVWELELDPGETIPVHTHTLDYVFYVYAGGTIEVFDETGAPAGTLYPKAGQVLGFRVDGEQLHPESGGAPVPATHSARNAGNERYREVLIETKP